jgi:hypothetical protein
MIEKTLYTQDNLNAGAARILTHHSVEPANKAAYILFFTGVV